MDSANTQAKRAVVHCETAAKLNFACHQSSYAFLRDLQIGNTSSSDNLNNVLVTFSSNPSFLKPKTWKLDRIAPNGVQIIKQRDLELDGNYLLSLADSLRGNVSIKVEAGGEILAEETKSVELLAFNEWGGAGYMPELLAAFCTPNDPAVDRVLREASLVLRKAGKPDGIDGYKLGSRQRVWEIVSAIYTAICNLGLSYAVPPASFERDGQKIRLPSQILENRVATCLDTTLLFAAAFEQAGLNPILVLPEGHAIVGVWLQPEDLSTIIIDKAEMLRKRVQLKELILVETTFATSNPSPPFSKAVAATVEGLIPEKDASFLVAIDIRRARAHRITPLGRKIPTQAAPMDSSEAEDIENTMEAAPALPDFENPVEEESKPETPSGRLERWQRKLLDLSSRNPLLNHKSTKTSIQFICPDPGFLEDRLAEGARISIQSVPKPTSMGQDKELHRQRTGEVITEEYAKDALERRQLLVDLPEEDLTKRAIEIYRKTQVALQEGGANTLFLAIGFLLWKHKENDEKRFRAPLILLPVSLERKSVRSGIRLMAHDDEPRFNTTLLEMLRKDFRIDIKGLDGSLPEDESGIDVKGVWKTVRIAVKESAGFEVIEDVVLGHFSFAKYLMWKDLVDRSADLRNSSIVKHLIETPREPFKNEISFVEASEIDRKFGPADLLTPLPADSSQMAAIATADRGKDFIIIGPPGTGKSQTISNLIAHILGKKKTVLFVSEKTAALEVVFRRLKKIGLGRFCLELHSNKARKADVLEQLRNSWEVARAIKPETWAAEAQRLRELRDQLNLVLERLHIRRRNGLSAHYAIGVKVRDGEISGRVSLTWHSADRHDEADLRKIKDSLTKLRIQAQAVGNPSGHPFEIIDHKEWSPHWEADVVQRAGSLSVAATNLQSSVEAFLSVIGITVPDMTIDRLDSVADLASVLLDSWRKQAGYALEPDGSDRIEALEEAVKRLKSYSEIQSSLSCPYEPLAWRKLDGERISGDWRAAKYVWWPKRYFVRRSIINEMKSNGAKGVPDPEKDGPLLKRLRIEGEAIDRLDKLLSGLREWHAHDTDAESAQAMQSIGIRIRSAVGKLADDAPALASLRLKVGTLVRETNDLLAPDAAMGKSATAFIQAHHATTEALSKFEALAGSSIRAYFASEKRALAGVKNKAEEISSRHADLRDWCGWRRRRAEALELELGPMVSAVEQGKCPVEEIESTFEAAYCKWWSGAVLSEDAVLRNFSAAEHAATIEDFRDMDSKFQKLTSEYVAAMLSGKLPESSDIQRKSSWGVLRHELQKKTRHKPVRQLVQEIPDVLTALAPCLMMSPLSVAQYLPANQTLFDVVIFDEASQITVWDAVGALARGRQVIIAGDPKQMPPSNFFGRSDDDPDGEFDAEGDLESILDEMLGASIPQRTLNLHYRSRRESLITFSNSRYYENSLVTFPAPVHPDKGIRHFPCKGFYARGGARHNEGEAREIVAEILRRLKSPVKSIREASIGVVTFNTEQQSLIENLLDDARSKHPETEWAFSQESCPEPVFVKNLETVQGDERDVILFSITYGPDQSDHVTMNFGPLNRTGGERRLNVALTRARSEMGIFSTLSPDRIDISRTGALAVKDLKHFLEFAERGPRALMSAVHGSVGDFESPFESAVAKLLRKKGWEVHPQVGVSAYRIDLGIVHPELPGKYLAGVECDGAMYHSSAFAQERDKIRQSVLTGLGWTLFRVWSIDWWTNPSKAIDMIHAGLIKHLEQDRVSTSRSSDEVSQTTELISKEESSIKLVAKRVAPIEPPNSPIVVSSLSKDESGSDKKTENYVFANLTKAGLVADPGLFYGEIYNPNLTAMIVHVVEAEGPIHEDVLVRRIARHHGFQRSGQQIRERVLLIAKQNHESSQEDVGIFFWAKGTYKTGRVPARYSGRDEDLKTVEFICKDEILSIARTLEISSSPVRVARAIGIGRLSQSAKVRIQDALGIHGSDEEGMGS
jgi:very-short-patch-repair endonuclease